MCDKNFLKKNGCLLMFITIIIIISIIISYKYCKEYPNAVDLTSIIPDGKNSNINNLKDAVNYLVDLNKFLISICTLSFGVIGFFITQYSEKIFDKHIITLYFSSIIFLGFSYYFSIKVYSTIVMEFSKGFIGLKLGQSLIIFYQEMSYCTLIGSSILLLFILIYIWYTKGIKNE